jgi:hypothetical protein
MHHNHSHISGRRVRAYWPEWVEHKDTATNHDGNYDSETDHPPRNCAPTDEEVATADKLRDRGPKQSIPSLPMVVRQQVGKGIDKHIGKSLPQYYSV